MLKRLGCLCAAALMAASHTVLIPPTRAVDFIIDPETIVVALAEEIPNIAEGSECADPNYWAGPGDEGGGDWQNERADGPYDSEEDAIQDAVDGASAGDTIFLCSGHWDFSGVVEIDKDLNIVGAGQSATILDGGDTHMIFTTWIVRGDPAVYSGYALNLSDMTLQHAYSGTGAAYFHEESSIVRCTFRLNRSENIGGALEAGSLLVEDSLFQENHSNWSGGAIFASSLQITGTRFIGNSNIFAGDGNDDASGGAITFSNSLTVDDSEFRNNRAENNEDGMNFAWPFGEGGWGYGGAIFGLPGQMSITNTKFYGNTSGSGGAVYVMWAGEQSIVGNTFVGNVASSAEGQGGAIRLSAVTNQTYIVKNTFSSNQAWQGGAVSLNDTGESADESWNATVKQNRFSRNLATGSGGALHFALDNSGRVATRYISRNLFSRNRAEVGGAIVIESNFGRESQIFRRFTRSLRLNRFMGNQAKTVRWSRNIGVHFD